MAFHNELGKRGEDIAVQYLADKGYGIMARNWRFASFEVDIIARNEEEIVFVEVKTRSSDHFQRPEEAVDYRRRRRIMGAAAAYVQYYKVNLRRRYDIISIVMRDGVPDIKHIEDAWDLMSDYNPRKPNWTAYGASNSSYNVYGKRGRKGGGKITF